MEISEETKGNLSRVALASGLPLENVEKEFRMMDLMRRLFAELEAEGVEAALFGGTALNKGYFLEKQRFSKDIDLDGDADKIGKAVGKFSGEFGVRLLKLRPESLFESWRLRYGHNPWEELIVDVNRKKLPFRPPVKKVEMHSLLEYYGFLVSPVAVPSYPFELLFARKLIALSRRAVGKDIYDSYLGFKLGPDRKELAKYLGMLVKDEFNEELWQFAATAAYWVKRANIRSESLAELLSTIPTPYRRSAAEMQNTIIFELEKLAEE